MQDQTWGGLSWKGGIREEEKPFSSSSMCNYTRAAALGRVRVKLCSRGAQGEGMDG